VRKRLPAWAGLLLALAGPACAHEVHHVIEATHAVAVRLSYADGKPLAFEAYEAYAEGKDMPAQVGRTDQEGRALFVPGAIKRWRLKAYTADGHGVDIRFDAPETGIRQGATSNAGPDSAPNRASLLLFGFSILLALFGTYQLWLRKKP